MPVRCCQLIQQLDAVRGQCDVDLTAIFGGGGAGDKFLRRQPVHKPNRAVVPDLQPLGKLAYCYVVPTRKAFNRQQRLMLLRRKPHLLRSLFTEVQKLP